MRGVDGSCGKMSGPRRSGRQQAVGRFPAIPMGIDVVEVCPEVFQDREGREGWHDAGKSARQASSQIRTSRSAARIEWRAARRTSAIRDFRPRTSSSAPGCPLLLNADDWPDVIRCAGLGERPSARTGRSAPQRGYSASQLSNSVNPEGVFESWSHRGIREQIGTVPSASSRAQNRIGPGGDCTSAWVTFAPHARTLSAAFGFSEGCLRRPPVYSSAP